jgi:bifunctional DNA-binding transcriptional regulator/antitoxin component of YhaV-PrlF toxin-antitoxin module
MYKLTVVEIGASLGIAFPKEVLDRLKVAKGDFVSLTETEGGYRITRCDPEPVNRPPAR